MWSKVSALWPLGIALSSLISTTTGSPGCSTRDTYDYIVVGSGPGGAPVASELSRNGFSVLLLEAGDDQRSNLNTSAGIALADVAAEDERLRWDFFVRYHADDEIHNSNRYMTWQTEDGAYYVGPNPPEGARQLGIYYPRSGTLGGCSAHNAGAAIVPQDSFWDHIANITGDASWGHENMRQYFARFENNTYLPRGTPGHGFDGWLATSIADPERAWANRTADLAILGQLAATLGHGSDQADLFERMRTDPNSVNPDRDGQQGLFGFPFHHTPLGNRTNANNLLAATLAERNAHGSPRNPLTIQLESLVTRVLFSRDDSRGGGEGKDDDDNSGRQPRAIGVEYLRGRSLYRADPRAGRAASATANPTTHRAFARREIIISAGVFNTPQLLKLSGIGPRDELRAFDIPLVADLPGVGARLQDDYEISLAATASVNLGPPSPPPVQCTLGLGDDPCLELWAQGRGPYAIPGPSHSIHLRSSVARDGERDLVLWNPPDVFRGFFPGYSRPQGDPPSTFSFAMVHTQGRNGRGGTVRLRSADPRDVPDIFFDLWAENADEDLQALYEGVEFGRRVLSAVAAPVGPFTEFQPCAGEIGTNCSEEATKEFIRRQVYSHHASSSAAIGADDDPLAVLDARFRVRGVRNLRVVDGSALPRPPSPFPILGQFMASFKAADVILEDAAKEEN